MSASKNIKENGNKNGSEDSENNPLNQATILNKSTDSKLNEITG